jgi:hypothetical protein
MACCALDLVSDIISFYNMLVANVPRPTVQFKLVHSKTRNSPASITLTTSQPPQSARMWYVLIELCFVFSCLILLPQVRDDRSRAS